MYHSVCMKVRGNLKEWIHSYYVGPRDWTKVIKLPSYLYVKNYLEPIPTFFFTYSKTYYMPVIGIFYLETVVTYSHRKSLT